MISMECVLCPYYTNAPFPPHFYDSFSLVSRSTMLDEQPYRMISETYAWSFPSVLQGHPQVCAVCLGWHTDPLSPASSQPHLPGCCLSAHTQTILFPPAHSDTILQAFFSLFFLCLDDFTHSFLSYISSNAHFEGYESESLPWLWPPRLSCLLLYGSKAQGSNIRESDSQISESSTLHTKSRI